MFQSRMMKRGGGQTADFSDDVFRDNCMHSNCSRVGDAKLLFSSPVTAPHQRGNRGHHDAKQAKGSIALGPAAADAIFFFSSSTICRLADGVSLFALLLFESFRPLS